MVCLLHYVLFLMYEANHICHTDNKQVHKMILWNINDVFIIWPTEIYEITNISNMETSIPIHNMMWEPYLWLCLLSYLLLWMHETRQTWHTNNKHVHKMQLWVMNDVCIICITQIYEYTTISNIKTSVLWHNMMYTSYLWLCLLSYLL